MIKDIKRNFFFKNTYKYNNLIYLLFFFVFLYLLFKNYSGNYKTVESFLWDRNFGLADYANDYFLNNSLHDKITIIYRFFGLLKINLSNDNVGFFIYSFFSILSAIFTFKIIKKFFNINNPQEILLTLIVLGYATSLLIYGNKSSWITNHSATQTFFVLSLKPLFLWFLFNKKFFSLAALSALMLLIGIKSSWFIVAVSILFSFFNQKNSFFWILSPLFVLIYIFFISPGIDMNEKHFFFENILLRDTAETAFHLQPLKNLILLILSFPINFYIVKNLKISSQTKNFLYILLYTSILAFLFFLVLAKYGLIYFPEPRILVLGGTRSLELYEFFFIITLLVFILQSKLIYLYKILLLILAINLVTQSYLAIIPAIFFIFILLFLYKKFYFISNLLDKNKSFYILIFLIHLIPGIIYLSYSHINSNVSLYSYQKINKWHIGTLSKNIYRIENLISLRNYNDFILLDLKYHPYSSLLSFKSAFYEDIHVNYFNKTLILESKKRLILIEDIKKAIKNKKLVKRETINKLMKYNVTLIVGNEESKFFPADTKSFDLKYNERLLVFSENFTLKKI